MKAIPTSTDKHKEERVKFAQANLENTFGGEGSEVLYIDIDEKNFRAFTENRVVYCPKELEHLFETFNSATKVSKEMVMFFGAIARPRPSQNFDGKVLILPIVKDKIMKRSSKYAKAHDVVQEPTTLDKKGFLKICKVNLLTAIREILELLPEVKKVAVQMDRAGGHGGGRGDMKGILTELNKAGSEEKIPVEFLTQSAKSPDFNALDLGAWYSLSCGVPAIKAEKNPTKKIHERIITEVLNRWEEWDSMTRLESIFATKSRIMKAVIEAKGDIKYEIPRSGNSHKNEKPAYVPKKRETAVTAEAVE